MTTPRQTDPGLLAALAGQRAFGTLDAPSREAFANLATLLPLTDGDGLPDALTAGDALHLIVRGEVVLQDAASAAVVTLRAGELFGYGTAARLPIRT
jgi:CBS domain-containing protein